LRSAGVDAPIILIGPPAIGEVETALEHDITLTLGSNQAVGELLQRVGQRRARVHIKVESGMNRYGFAPDRVVEVVSRLNEHAGIEVEGIFTHFSSADEVDPGPTLRQLERFRVAVRALEERGVRPRYVHAANSAGILTDHFAGTNLVRSGIATYGLSPSPEVPVDGRFKPVMSVWSVVTRRSTLVRDDGVGYGLTYRAVEDEQIAAVPVGYADGLPRRLRNQGWFVIHGERAPIRGSVCMDQTVVSAPARAREGDSVLILGSGATGEMTFDAIAEIIGTVNYEVATRVMARVPRLYLRSGEPVAWEVVLTGERGRRSP
jgi:alanine racemase